MCGIAGSIIYSEEGKIKSVELLTQAIRGCRSRGIDSFGMVSWHHQLGWSEIREFHDATDEAIGKIKKDTINEGAFFYLHTSRAEPTTEWEKHKNTGDIPPFCQENIALAHNGIISNDQELVNQYKINRNSKIDTAIVPALVKKLGMWEAIKKLKGGCAIGIVDSSAQALYLYRNFLPLTLAWAPGVVVFASELNFFDDALKPFSDTKIWQLPLYTGIELSKIGYRYPINLDTVGDSKDNLNWIPYPDLKID